MVSNRAKNVSSFLVMDVLAKAQEMERNGDHIIHLEVGEPDFDTPEIVQNVAIEAIKSGETHYTHALGSIELREEICKFYKINYDVEVTPDRVLITSGTSPGMLLMMMAILDIGDEVILPDPHYPCYPNFVEAIGGKVTYVKTKPEDGFVYQPKDIQDAITDRTKGILINSPSNPTGIVMTDEQLKQVASFTDQYILSDEIYHGLTYEGKASSILQFTDKAFVVNGFSKLFAMTGWRLGYMIYPKEFIGVMEILHQNFMISSNSFVQKAGIAAIQNSHDVTEKMKEKYNERRLYMIARLESMGLKIHQKPTGAFYVFADAKDFCTDSYSEAFRILEKAKVGVTPGIDFGKASEGFLRFSYANSIENIKEGLDRLEKYIQERRNEI